MRIIKYFLALPLVMALILTGCSDYDDDYQPAEPLQAGNEQVHFSPENVAKTIIGSEDKTREVAINIVRSTTSGTVTVPVTLSNATPGITADQQATFADGTSTATIHVELPDTAKAGDKYTYTLTVSGENTDPYTLLDGGLSFSGTAVIAKSVKILCDIYYSDGVNESGSWTEKGYDLGDGLYMLYDFGNSGHTVYLQTNSEQGYTLPYVENDKDVDQYDDNYGTNIGLGYFLYPWGKEKAAIGYVYLLSSKGYSGFDATDKSGWFYLTQWWLSKDEEADYWASFYFWIEE
jgi:hypothetical protein